jgi:hypothetical protein
MKANGYAENSCSCVVGTHEMPTIRTQNWDLAKEDARLTRHADGQFGDLFGEPS